MNINDIDISKIKVAIFDFDETLALHKDKDFINHRNETEDKRLGYYLNAYENPETFYKNIEPCDLSTVLYNLISKLRKNEVKLYCLSGMTNTFHLKAKQFFVTKNYGSDIEVLSTSSQKLKLDGVKIIAKHCNCNLNEILFVDDMQDVISMLLKNEVKAYLISELYE